jgi:2-methylisocitrate lyase-like PEP mutase family enzyme
VARTDASDPADVERRLRAYAAAGADALLVDGVEDPALLGRLTRSLRRPFAFNQIAGGLSPSLSLGELQKLGVGLVVYSTPCLFAAQSAVETALDDLVSRDGLLPAPEAGAVGVKACTALLDANLDLLAATRSRELG